MNLIEWIAAAFGLANIALLVRRSAWNYPFGMIVVAMYAVIFFEARLYAEAGLQVFFFAAQAWGWALWVRAADTADGREAKVPVRWLTARGRAAWGLVTATLALNLGWAMHVFTNASLPYADAAIAGTSIAAQILLGLRRIENWILWIAIDVASVAVYVAKGLWPTAALYVVFLGMSVLGYREWMAAYRRQG